MTIGDANEIGDPLASPDATEGAGALLGLTPQTSPGPEKAGQNLDPAEGLESAFADFSSSGHQLLQHRWKCAEIVGQTVSDARLLHATATQSAQQSSRNLRKTASNRRSGCYLAFHAR
ncbi:hypothetical protein [Sphingomonas aracearum]|uniref:hypothetical protein n=1 Tax=Sphingomonas aracearum TaxID=2283317 RepID=UPI0011C057F1|nr:hypothetical protein [Sphingomonas aracearum]